MFYQLVCVFSVNSLIVLCPLDKGMCLIWKTSLPPLHSSLSMLKSQQAMSCPVNMPSTFLLTICTQAFLSVRNALLSHTLGHQINSTHPSLPSLNIMSVLQISHFIHPVSLSCLPLLHFVDASIKEFITWN